MSKKNIFVVDDSEMFSNMLRDHLSENPGYNVTVYSTGEECLKNLYLNPDIIILDFYLNDVYKEAADGLAILEQIKKQKSPAHVIMLSSQERYVIAAQTISKGAEQYVIKDDNAFDNIDKILAEI